MATRKIKRITLEVDAILHSNVKKIALSKEVSIKNWVLEAIADKIRKDAELGFK